MPPTATRDQGVRAIQNIYREMKRLTDGADGGVLGVNGSIRPKGLAKILRALGVKGKELVDFGAGSGRVLFAAESEGASLAIGYEFPENIGMKYVFDASIRTLAVQAKDRVAWLGIDILSLTKLNGFPFCAFSFWVGFPLPVQEQILRLCAETETVQTIAVFRDSKWPNYMLGLC